MEWRRVKNIIILVLLLVNGFLLILVGARRGEVRRYEQAALDQAIQVLAEHEIQVSADEVVSADGLAIQTAERNIPAEEAMVCALLGETISGQNQGGGLYTYVGNRGSVNFRAGGELFAALEKDSRWQAAEPVAHATQLLNEMKVETQLMGSDLAGGNGTVTFRQLWQGASLFSCKVVFTYEDGLLVSLSGNLLPVKESMAESEKLLSLPTALLRFLDEILASGDVCSAIVSMEPGYRMTQSFTSAVRLNPIWMISSNTADYYMDAVTGELSRISGE